jgi:hypothetical protein
MKLAVCVSGLVRGEYLKRNNEVLKLKFPNADFYYATWTRDEKKFRENFLNDSCFIFDEPDMHYHPYSKEVLVSAEVKPHYENSMKLMFSNGKINKDKYEWLLNSTKQILIHAMLLEQIKKDYDVIVRTRFDAYLWENEQADFSKFVENCFNERTTHGFGILAHENNHKMLHANPEKKNSKFTYRVCDFLIIHQRNMIDSEKVFSLHKNKQLRGAEYGWYQLLSEPYARNNKNWLGWLTKSDWLNKEIV